MHANETKTHVSRPDETLACLVRNLSILLLRALFFEATVHIVALMCLEKRSSIHYHDILVLKDHRPLLLVCRVSRLDNRRNLRIFDVTGGPLCRRGGREAFCALGGDRR